MKFTTTPEATMSEYETLLQQINDARKLQYNAVMMRDTSGTVSHLDAILEELYAKQDRMNRGM